MRKMYAEGIIDPEFFTNKYYDDQTKFKQGRVALLHGGITNIPEFAAKDVPNAAEIYSFHPALKGENDEKPRNEAAAATWGGWMINADVDPEKRRVSCPSWTGPTAKRALSPIAARRARAPTMSPTIFRSAS